MLHSKLEKGQRRNRREYEGREKGIKYIAPKDISRFVHDVTSPRRVVFATRTIFNAMPICPAVVVSLIRTARVMRPVAIAATTRSRTIPSHCWRQSRIYDGC
jgi:hypothetical protein